MGGQSPSCGTPDCALPATQAKATLGLPVWHVGDWWNYTVSLGGRSAFTHVVSADHGDEWFMDTDNPTSAFHDLQQDTSYLGPIRKSDIAGSQGTDRIAYMQWPLADNKTWTTQWDGTTKTVKAHRIDAAHYLMEARNGDGTAYAHYVYDADVGWFRNVTFHNEIPGLPEFSFQLSAWGHNYPGTVARWHLQTIADLAGDLAAPPASGNFDVPLNATDVWAAISVSCTSGTAILGVAPLPVATSIAGTDPRGAGMGGSPCPQSGNFTGSAGAAKAPPQGGSSETWGYSVAAAPGTVGTYVMKILVRSLQRVPVMPVP